MSRNDPYAAHARFIRPAYAASAPLLVIVVLLGFEVILGFTGILTFEILPQDVDFPDASPFGTILGFALFGLSLLLFHGLVKLVHKRGIGSMLGPLGQLWYDGRRALFGVGALLLSLEILMPSYGIDEIVETRNALFWAVLLPIGFVAILIQCTTEEVVYRGYLQQQIAVLTRGPLAYLVVPSVIFGLGHYWNGWGVSDGILYAYWATLLGLACADLTARTGSLGAAIGLHTANNLYATFLFAEQSGPTSGLALFLTEYVDWSAFDYSLESLFSVWTLFDMAFSTITVLLMWLAARIAIRR